MDKLMTKAVADATGVMDDTAEIFINRLAEAGYAVVPGEITPEIACALEDAAPPSSPHWDTHPCKDAAIKQLMNDWSEGWANALAAALAGKP